MKFCLAAVFRMDRKYSTQYRCLTAGKREALETAENKRSGEHEGIGLLHRAG